MESTALTQMWIDAINRGDKEAVVDLYDAQRGVLLGTFAQEVAIGRDAVQSYFDGFMALPKLRATILTIATVEGSHVTVDSGHYRFEFVKDGVRSAIDARFSFAWERAGDGWRIAHHHSSVIPQLTPGQAARPA